jgi:hypothetical protein
MMGPMIESAIGPSHCGAATPAPRSGSNNSISVSLRDAAMGPPFQIPRQKILAKARNHLLSRAPKDQAWVLWLDVDVIDYPADLIERLIATGRGVVHPHCVKRYGGPTYDLNGWRDQGRVHMDDLCCGPNLARLDTVGATVLLVRADVHRDGFIFPCFPHGAASSTAQRPGPLAVDGALETEGSGIMARDMGHQCWGMPNLEVLRAPV